MNATCLACHFKKQVETAQALGDADTATAFAKALMQAYLDAPADAASPYFSPIVSQLLAQFYGVTEDRYQEEKRLSNQFVLSRMDTIRQIVQAQPDPVYAGLQFAILGNYLDFSALKGQVSFEKLEQMLAMGLEMELAQSSYHALCQDLANSRNLLYLTDNAGEIGFDRIFAEAIQEKYPHLQITFCVRGGPALNDATREDAALVQIPFPVIDNGSCIPGTIPSLLGQEARQAMENAQVILAKGMANVETLYGHGYPVYYAFLVKCAHFVDLFQKPLMTPMLVKEPNRK